jgi:hypothetical protein
MFHFDIPFVTSMIFISLRRILTIIDIFTLADTSLTAYETYI